MQKKKEKKKKYYKIHSVCPLSIQRVFTEKHLNIIFFIKTVFLFQRAF